MIRTLSRKIKPKAIVNEVAGNASYSTVRKSSNSRKNTEIEKARL